MPNPIIERAARAIQDEYDRQNSGALIGEGGDLHAPEAMARAVLRAIREPSEAMNRAGWKSDLPFTPSIRVDVLWQAMIDAALSD